MWHFAIKLCMTIENYEGFFFPLETVAFDFFPHSLSFQDSFFVFRVLSSNVKVIVKLIDFFPSQLLGFMSY